MSSPRTTALGVLTILTVAVNAAIALLKGLPVDWGTAVAGVTAGIGLIHAADSPTAPASPIPGR